MIINIQKSLNETVRFAVVVADVPLKSLNDLSWLALGEMGIKKEKEKRRKMRRE